MRLTTILGSVVKGLAVKVKSVESPSGDVVPIAKAMTAGVDK